MKALVVCPTYGRLPYLGRLLSSFLNQTYDDKHLIIINDDNNVVIDCDYDNVSVLNCTKRLSVGEKKNLGASYGHYDIIHPWDDDDIFYPNRLENHMKQYLDDSVIAYRNFSSYILHGNKFTTSEGGVNSKSYRKKQFFELGGYETVINFGEDQELHWKLVRSGGFKLETNDEERDFLYGFGNSNYHLSCGVSGKSIEVIARQQLLDMCFLNKRFTIEPDEEQYNIYLTLDRMYKNNPTDITLRHTTNGKIDISHLDESLLNN